MIKKMKLAVQLTAGVAGMASSKMNPFYCLFVCEEVVIIH